jgi:hypothetical protein
MKKLIFLISVFFIQVNFAQNTVPATGSVNLDTSLKIGNQVSTSNGEIVRFSIVPYRHTSGPWNFKSRDITNTAFLDIDYGATGSALTITSDKNIGIGTLTPTAKLEVSKSSSADNNEIIASLTRFASGTGGSSIVRFGYHNTCDFEVNSGYTNIGNRFGTFFDLNIVNNHAGGSHGGINFVTNSSVKMAINVNGNVGIGTSNPKSKFEVTDWTTALTIGSMKNTEAMIDNEVIGAINFYKHYNIGYAGAIKLLQAGNGNQNSPAHLAFFTTSGGNVYTTAPEERMRITSLGNIGIGTITPDSKLAVNGTIHSKEVKVDLTGWPDYVFKKEYSLPTLEEVEKHIAEKGHLENIPSEEEVLKNGVNLGEMNAKLLQKIEELTLYMIEMKKENEKQNEEIKILKTKVPSK